MGKRQVRYTGINIIKTDLLGKNVQFVMTNGSVSHMKILKISSTHLLAEDMRKKKYNISVENIYEIILDIVSYQ